MNNRKYVKILQDTDEEKLLEEINKLMEESMCWDLITVDSQEQRSLGVGVYQYTAWLQYEKSHI